MKTRTINKKTEFLDVVLAFLLGTPEISVKTSTKQMQLIKHI